MATRTIKLMGKAYSTEGDVSLVVNFNSTEVFNGTVSTTNSAAPATPNEAPVELASWTVDTSLSGAVPLSIAVSGGTFHFTDLIGNYAGPIIEEGVVVTDTASNFGNMNSNNADSDGKDNVSITNDEGDGQSRAPQNADEETGEWVYVVPAGETLTCDFTIDASLTVL